MGYSLSSAASATLEAFNDRNVSGSSNTYYAETTGAEMFYEIGNENSDGSCTGEVYRVSGKNADGYEMCRKVGTFKIDSGGEIVRFPGVTRKTMNEISECGLKNYEESLVRLKKFSLG
jgi:hypothetical protein